MIRTGVEYRGSIRDRREIWIDGERVGDVTTHPAFKPIVDVRARIYDMAHKAETQDVMSYVDPSTGERCAVGASATGSLRPWLQGSPRAAKMDRFARPDSFSPTRSRGPWQTCASTGTTIRSAS